ncbi:MAG: hypothetical protein ACRDSF_13370 [Pseudonocardiaceae bacterium]
MADGQGDQAGKLAFLEQQRQHPCTDCGHSYLAADPVSEGSDFRREIVGGGTVVSSNHGPITEVHIVPHCGTEVPGDLIDDLDPEQLPALSELVHGNADIGTGAIYRTLVEDVVSGESKGVVVAGFHLSRILLDANRAKLEEQMPLRPYVGSADIYSKYLRRRRDELREEALIPWLEAVDAILRKMSNGVVYHHHTYDVSSLSPRPWDRGPDLKRPAFQLVWKKPAWEAVFDHEEQSRDGGLAPLEDIEGVRDRICRFLQVEMGIVDSEGAIDYPLRLPVIPFSGARSGDPPDMPQHVMYDLRKDVLVTEEKVRSWVAARPWRLARAPLQTPQADPSEYREGKGLNCEQIAN